MRILSPDVDAAALSLSVLRLLFRDAYARDFSIRLWDGTVVASSGTSRFELHITAPHALRAALMPPLDLNPGRAVVQGLLEINGDSEAAVDAIMAASARSNALVMPRLLGMLLRLPKPEHNSDERTAQLHGRAHSRERDAEAVAFHYNQPLSLYRSFLDLALVYSCAYWDEGIDDLEHAQEAKIDYVLRKAGVRAGMSILDIGCGWGALVMRAAETLGVTAAGITLSTAQYEEANRLIDARGLGDRVTVELLDYRALGKRSYDAIVSVGMAEHVGRARLEAYFRAAYQALRPGGRFVNHAIADQSPNRRGGKATGFIDRYIFPDGELVAVSEMNLVAERAGFEVRDVENLREHYARTLRSWVARLETNRQAAIEATSEATWRAWRLYLAGSAQGFRSGRLGLFQTVFAKLAPGGDAAFPATRRAWYR